MDFQCYKKELGIRENDLVKNLLCAGIESVNFKVPGADNL